MVLPVIQASTTSGLTSLMLRAALATFLLAGNVYFPLAIAGAIANICGNYVGSGMVLKDASRIVKPIIIIVLVLLFVKILWQG